MSVQDLASKARKHWATWLPQRTAMLKEAGSFQAETQAAAAMAQDEKDRLMQQGYRDHEAEEVVLHQFILLKPEQDSAVPPDQASELAAKEAEYQQSRQEA